MVADMLAGVTNTPVYIGVHSDVTGPSTGEGGAQTGLVRIEEKGGSNYRYHGIDLRNRNSGDIRIMNCDRGNSDQGDLVIAMPTTDGSSGIKEKIRISSQNDSISIMGKGGATIDTHSNAVERVDVYIKTKTDMTSVMSGEGGDCAGLIRFEDKGGNNNRYHGIDLRNKNNGDIRILNKDVGASDRGQLVIAMNTTEGGVETLKINEKGHRILAYQPRFMAYRDSSSITNISNGTITGWNAVKYDVGSNFSNGTKFTAPTTGTYMFGCNIRWGCSGKIRVIRVQLDHLNSSGGGKGNYGGGVGGSHDYDDSTGYDHPYTSFTNLVEMDAGDYIQIALAEVAHDGQLDLQAQGFTSNFWGCLMF